MISRVKLVAFLDGMKCGVALFGAAVLGCAVGWLVQHGIALGVPQVVVTSASILAAVVVGRVYARHVFWPMVDAVKARRGKR